jgi:hypothetical protein
LASNFETFLDKLLDLLQELSTSFADYKEIAELCISGDKNQPSKIPEIIEAVYRDVLQIFHAVIQLFTKSEGGELTV